MTSVSGQDLIKSRQSGYYTYIFKISDSEAEKIYKNKSIKWMKHEEYFHTLIDSFPLYTEYKKTLDPGHYLRVSVKGNKIEAGIASVLNICVQVINNNTDLCIQLYDSTGKITGDAEVRIGVKRLRFDEQVKGFLLKKSNRKGTLRITYKGIVSFFDLHRNRNNPVAKRLESAVLLGSPLKVIWIPVKFVIGIPVFSVKEIVNGRMYSFGYDFINFCRRHGFGRSYYRGNKFKGYFVFSKPKYLPGDTVRFKTYIVNGHGKPVSRELKIMITKSSGKKVELGKIKPAIPGNYHGQFVLADSLDLDLDRNHDLQLTKGKWKTVSEGYFMYEDYELKNITLKVNTDNDTQIRGKEFRVHIRTTDENDLNILDGRIELTIKSRNIIKQYDKNVFIRDTLLFRKMKLEQMGETSVTIPDSVFPRADLSYSLEVKVIRTDNAYRSFTKNIEFFDHHTELTYELKQDSILFIVKMNGKDSVCKAAISGIDRFEISSESKSVTLPYKEKINPFFESYKISAADLTKTITIPPGLSSISCESDILDDTLRINITNPRNLPFTWFLYRANHLEGKGYGTKFYYKEKIPGGVKYFLSLVYLWSGETRSETFNLSGNQNGLNIKVEQPALVYPGQKVTLGIKVTDKAGSPVEGVDLTAFSYTRKFAENPPGIYEFPDTRRSKKLINTFGVNEKIHNETFNNKLDYERWKRLFSLDTIEYYNFLYHRKEIYFYSYRPADGITQFSPFVVKDGEISRINVVYVDRVPVYFGWTGSQEKPYSFMVDSGYHFIEIRTSDKLFKVDSVYFRNGKKLIMCINDIAKPISYKVYETKHFFGENEKSSLNRFIFPYRNNFGNEYAYLKQGEKITLLNIPDKQVNTGNSYYNSYGESYLNLQAAGPVYPSLTYLNIPGGYGHSFINEPEFEYEFSSSLIKMRCAEKKQFIPGYLYGTAVTRLADFPLSEKRIMESYDELVFQRKLASARFRIAKSTLPGYGELNLQIDSLAAGFGPVPLFIVLTDQNHTGPAKVYPGNTLVVENLDPGLYSINLVFRGDKYFRYDSIPVRTGGRNFTRLPRPGRMVQDSFALRLKNIIEDEVYRSKFETNMEFENYLKRLQRQQSLTRYSGEGMIVSGMVKDQDGPLPGVNVIVKGTTIGTITDLNGGYSLLVPFDSKELIFSFIGYKQAEVAVKSEFTDVTLIPEVMALQEVVVVGYGVSRRSNMLASSVSSTLSGKISGVAITGANSGTIRIRGISSVNAANAPLFIIDGVPYSGDISDLDPSMLTNVEVIKDESMISIYGSRAANGVVMISTSGMNLKNSKIKSFLKGAEYSDAFMQAVASASSIRTNFSDYAYWKPNLVTDRNGKASFEVRFPDDVTNWSTYVMAMNGNKQSGQTSGSIKSFKPLMAQLFTPRFLIEGDSTNLIGKILNYTPDTLRVSVSMEINGRNSGSKTMSCINSINDTLPLRAYSTDTISAKYYFRKEDGYLDGEERKIPVFRKGLEMTRGEFFVLNGDSTVNVLNDKNLGEGMLYAQADRLDVINDEIGYLSVYSYECNEQLASKLIALLAQENISKFKGNIFLRKNLVNRLIRTLGKNQNSDGCWGWWDRSETSLWVTIHVMDALTTAQSMGYGISLNKKSLHDYVIWKLESETSEVLKLDLLYLMSFTDEKIDYARYMSQIKEDSLKSLVSRFRFIELKQRKGVAYTIDSVLKYENRTMFGNIYFGKTTDDQSVCFNEVQTTLAAYRILKRDQSKSDDYTERIRNFFFERRRLGRWQNTFESASIIETILPDIIRNPKGETKKSKLVLSGSVTKTVTEFPFEIKTKPSDSINISKSGTFPVYLTGYQHYWKTDPSADTTAFTIETKPEGNNMVMTAGKPEKMKISLRVHKDAQYVMIEIPVPGGCSYESKNGYFTGASHTEFFKDHVAVFYDYMKPGRYDFEIDLLPRFTGKYTINPAKAELMYFPVFNANNALKELIIK